MKKPTQAMLLVVVVCIFGFPGRSSPRLPIRALAMGGACLALPVSSDALFLNPAALGLSARAELSSNTWSAGPGLASQVVLSGQRGALGFEAFSFGDCSLVDEDGNVLGSFSYAEWCLAGGGVWLRSQVGTRFPIALSAGSTIRATLIDSANSEGTWSLDTGILLSAIDLGGRFVDGVSMGIVARGVLGTHTFTQADFADATAGFGVACRVLGLWWLAVDFMSDGSASLGYTCQASRMLSIQGGVRSCGVLSPSFGVALAMERVSIELALEAHPLLGPCGGAAVRFRW